MIITGITGGIGSGKTTVCRIFEILGVPVYYADDEAKDLYGQPEIVAAVVKEFGEGILENGVVGRKALASLVFGDSQKLARLNAIIHPAVKAHFISWCNRQQAAYVLKEAAILFESGAYRDVRKTITVTAPEDLRASRVMKRDGLSRDEVESRMLNQWSDEEKIKRSDFVILNDEEHLVIPEVLKIHAILSRG